MGSRKGGDFRKFAGKTKASKTNLQRIQNALGDKRSSRIIVGTAIGYLAASNPTISTLVATYKVSKVLYRMTKVADKTYQKTGNSDAAVKAAAGEAVRSVTGASRDGIIDNMVDVGWATIKRSAGINTNTNQDRLLASAAKSTLDEVLPK